MLLFKQPNLKLKLSKLPHIITTIVRILYIADQGISDASDIAGVINSKLITCRDTRTKFR